MPKITWFGHSAFLIEGEINILIDPFLDSNPVSPVKSGDIKNIDLILVTHGHMDHVGDSIRIAEENKCPIVAIYELAQWLSSQGVDTIAMNYGGMIEYEGVKIAMAPAVHTGSVVESKIYPTGNAAGFIIETDYKRIYHAGDTMVFTDMKLFPKIFGPLDLAMLPVGGRYTMDIKQAIIALKYLKPKVFVPMHYNTWDQIKIDVEKLVKVVGKLPIELKLLKPGESFEL